MKCFYKNVFIAVLTALILSCKTVFVSALLPPEAKMEAETRIREYFLICRTSMCIDENGSSLSAAKLTAWRKSIFDFLMSLNQSQRIEAFKYIVLKVHKDSCELLSNTAPESETRFCYDSTRGLGGIISCSVSKSKPLMFVNYYI